MVTVRAHHDVRIPQAQYVGERWWQKWENFSRRTASPKFPRRQLIHYWFFILFAELFSRYMIFLFLNLVELFSRSNCGYVKWKKSNKTRMRARFVSGTCPLWAARLYSDLDTYTCVYSVHVYYLYFVIACVHLASIKLKEYSNTFRWA